MRRSLSGVPVHAIDARSPSGGITPSSLAAAVRACASVPSVGVIVISSSWQAARPVGAEDLDQAIADARAPVLVAAGNRGAIEYPATLPTVRSVGAVDEHGQACPFSASSPRVSDTATGCASDDDQWGTSIAVGRAAAQLLRAAA